MRILDKMDWRVAYYTTCSCLNSESCLLKVKHLCLTRTPSILFLDVNLGFFSFQQGQQQMLPLYYQKLLHKQASPQTWQFLKQRRQTLCLLSHQTLALLQNQILLLCLLQLRPMSLRDRGQQLCLFQKPNSLEMRFSAALLNVRRFRTLSTDFCYSSYRLISRGHLILVWNIMTNQRVYLRLPEWKTQKSVY